MSARVCVVTAGHLSSCPRMLKAADALTDAGYRVHVISTRYIDWATTTDVAVRRAHRPWEWTEVRYDLGGGPINRWSSAVRMRAARALSRAVGVERAPPSVAARAFGRFHSELTRAARRVRPDLFYGGTSTAMAVVAEAGRSTGVPYAIDLEDFHSGEQEPPGRFSDALAARLEDEVLRGAVFLTAASDAMAAAYRARYGVVPVPIHNTFPLPAAAPDRLPREHSPLRLYWFSQTIGPKRGLEEAVRAMGAAGLAGELHLRGRPLPEYLRTLERLAAEVAPRLRLVELAPASPDEMVELCRPFDVGLALESSQTASRQLALTNKALTYILAGLPVAITDTPGQRPLANDLGAGALLVSPGDIAGLARGLVRWAEDREALAQASAAAWEAARRRWHWEHESERGALLAAVERVLGR